MARACCASGATYSRITGVSLGWLLKTMSPSVVVSNLSSPSSIFSRLSVVTSNLSIENDFSSTCTSLRLVSGAKQLYAERRKRLHVVRIDFERFAAQRHRFFEAVIRGRELRGHAIRAAEPRVDLEGGRRLLLQVRVTILDIRDRPTQRQRVEARRVDRLRLRDRRLGRFTIALVELEHRLQQVRVDDVRIEREGLLDGLLRRGRIHVEQRLRHSHERGNPLVVNLECILERLRRLGVVVHMQEKFSPAGMQGRIVRRFFGGDAIRVVGELKLTQRARGATKARVLGRRRARAHLHVGDAPQQGERLVATTHHFVEQAKLERGFTVGRPRHERLEQGFGLRILRHD